MAIQLTLYLLGHSQADSVVNQQDLNETPNRTQGYNNPV